MPGVINRVPRGLQGLVGNAMAGNNPSLLADDVRSVLDIMPFWSAELLKRIEASTTNLAIGTSVVMNVPDNKVWIPLHLNTVVGNTGAPNLIYQIGVGPRALPSDSGGANNNYVGNSPILDFAGVANAQLRFSYSYPMIQVLPPGSGLRASVGYAANSGVATTLEFNIIYLELTA